MVTNYIHTADSQSQVFWSHRADGDCSGRDGVALVLSGSHPFASVADLSTTYAPADLLHHYLVVEAMLGHTRLFIHVVHATVQVQDRKSFFESLPTHFPDDACYLVLSDLNIPMDPFLDELVLIRTILAAANSACLNWVLLILGGLPFLTAGSLLVPINATGSTTAYCRRLSTISSTESLATLRTNAGTTKTTIRWNSDLHHLHCPRPNGCSGSVLAGYSKCRLLPLRLPYPQLPV